MTPRRFTLPLLVAALAAALLLLAPHAASAATLTARPLSTATEHGMRVDGFQYAGSSSFEQLTATLNPNRRSAPWVLVIHGGSWINGTRANTASQALVFAERGWQAFNVEYSRGASVAYDEQVSDLRAAASFIRAHAAQFGVDPARGATYGMSAGGQLAAVVGLSDRRFRGVVSLSGVLQPTRVCSDAEGMRPSEPGSTSMTHLCEREASMMGCTLPTTDPDCVARWAAFSPQNLATASSPPVYMAQGDDDVVVPPGTVDAFGYWLSRARVSHVIVHVPGYGHSYDEVFGSAARTSAMLRWLEARTG